MIDKDALEKLGEYRAARIQAGLCVRIHARGVSGRIERRAEPSYYARVRRAGLRQCRGRLDRCAGGLYSCARRTGRLHRLRYRLARIGRPSRKNSRLEQGQIGELPYSDLDVWVASVRFTLLSLIPGLALAKIVVVTEGKQAEKLPSKLLMDLAWYCEDIWDI